MARNKFHPALITCAFALTCTTPIFAQTVASLDVATPPSVSHGSPTVHALQIAGGDLLDVSVFDTTELSGRFRVNERGTIVLPLAGEVAVSGLTADEAGHEIEKKLLETNILRYPHASVTVLEYATQGVTVVGEVKNPGVYPLLGAHGLLDLVSAAGGTTPSAGAAITITHRDDLAHPIVAKMDRKPGSNSLSAVDIRPGDTIVVSHAGVVYVMGDVGKPGGFVTENNDQLSVLQAIALAQGPNRTASLDRAKIIRKTAAGREETPIPLKKIMANKASDELLADGDILLVPSSGPKNAMRDVENILPAVTGAAIYRIP